MSTSSILLTMCSSFILLTWPHHLSHFFVIFLDACVIFVVPLMCSFRILSRLVTMLSVPRGMYLNFLSLFPQEEFKIPKREEVEERKKMEQELEQRYHSDSDRSSRRDRGHHRSSSHRRDRSRDRERSRDHDRGKFGL